MAKYNYLISGVTKTEYEDLIRMLDGKETFLKRYLANYQPEFEIDFKYNSDKLLIGFFINNELVIGPEDKVIIDGRHINFGILDSLKMDLEKTLGEVRLKKDKWI